jgi:hypothetical protein
MGNEDGGNVFSNIINSSILLELIRGEGEEERLL